MKLATSHNAKEIHKDLGLYSFDAARQRVILREFYSEGYVNIYIMEEVDGADNQLVFTTEQSENAGRMRARLRIEIISQADTRIV